MIAKTLGYKRIRKKMSIDKMQKRESELYNKEKKH